MLTQARESGLDSGMMTWDQSVPTNPNVSRYAFDVPTQPYDPVRVQELTRLNEILSMPYIEPGSAEHNFLTAYTLRNGTTAEKTMVWWGLAETLMSAWAVGGGTRRQPLRPSLGYQKSEYVQTTPFITSGPSRGAQLRSQYGYLTAAARQVRIQELAMGNRILREAGVPQQYISEALQSFEPGTITTRLASESEFGLRFYGGLSGPKSPYLMPTFPGGSVRSLTAPPRGNTLQYIKQWQIRPGTPLLEGRIRGKFGQPGGGRQMYVPNFYNNLLEP